MMDSSSVRRALSVMREEISPTRDDKARLRARIVAPAALMLQPSAGREAAAAGGAAPALPLTRWAALKAAGSIGVTAGVTLLGVGGGVGFWLGHEVAQGRGQAATVLDEPASVAVAPLPRAALPALDPTASVGPASSAEAVWNEANAAPAATAAAPIEAPPVSESRRTAPAPRAHAARSKPNPLADELALLRRVERALRNNDPALARALLGELDERFPDSRLGEERSAARRIADCRSSEPGANDRARAFLRDHRTSVYRQRIVLACALDHEPREPSVETAPMKNAEPADTHVR
jgi:hypothetical protein